MGKTARRCSMRQRRVRQQRPAILPWLIPRDANGPIRMVSVRGPADTAAGRKADANTRPHHLSVMLSENRFTLFGIMLTALTGAV